MRFPTLVGEHVLTAIGERPQFWLGPWASGNGFKYPRDAYDFMNKCGSAAEAYFVREFAERKDVSFEGEGKARAGSLEIELQVRAANYYIDAVVTDGKTRLAIEIDGMGWHHKTKEQVAQDYLRERRIVLQGYTVIRFTAKEVLSSPAECWRQVYAIMERRA